jgi:hypothetical protein
MHGYVHAPVKDYSWEITIDDLDIIEELLLGNYRWSMSKDIVGKL